MNENFDNKDSMEFDEVELYRKKRVEQFKMNFTDDPVSTPQAQPEPEVDTKTYMKPTEHGVTEEMLNFFSDDKKEEAEKTSAETAENKEKETAEKSDDSKEKSEFTDEISSFSDENTKAQIERESKKELRRQKREARKIERIKSGKNKKVYTIAWLILTVIIAVIMTRFLLTGCNDFFAIKRTDDSEATVRVKENYTVSELALQLEDLGVIDSRTFFVMFAGLTGKLDDIMPGIYHIPKNKDYLGILNHLQFTGNVQSTIEVVIPEGTNILELAEILYVEGVTSEEDKDKFLELCNSDEFDKDFPFLAEIEKNADREFKLEGYMFPDTYEFYIYEAPDQTIRRFLNNFENRFFTQTYDVEGYEEPVTLNQVIEDGGKYTLDEYVNMASIIQAEAADTADMFNVSSVIHNRLDYGAEKGIHNLGMDSTIFYPYKNKDAVPDDVDTDFDKSQYNTYKIKGLPPSAICSPSADALLSAVAPADTDYLYFCHSADGTPYYAETYSKHQSNLSKAGLD